MKLSERIAAARKRKKLSQVQLAELVGVSAGTVGGWESQRNGISKRKLPLVAEVLGLKVADLLN